MDSNKLAVKFFLTSGQPLPSEQLAPVMHGWIQRKALPGHLLIDVADYKHVPEGPGILLVSLEANVFLDHAPRPGLMYVRKRPIESAHTLAERLREVFFFALRPVALLESESAFTGSVRFATDRFALRIYDRLLAPNTPATLAEVKPVLSDFVAEAYGKPPASVEATAPADGIFELTVKTGSSPTVTQLLDRLSPVATRAS